jgi:hypothetical protein
LSGLLADGRDLVTAHFDALRAEIKDDVSDGKKSLWRAAIASGFLLLAITLAGFAVTQILQETLVIPWWGAALLVAVVAALVGGAILYWAQHSATRIDALDKEGARLKRDSRWLVGQSEAALQNPLASATPTSIERDRWRDDGGPAPDRPNVVSS